MFLTLAWLPGQIIWLDEYLATVAFLLLSIGFVATLADSRLHKETGYGESRRWTGEDHDIYYEDGRISRSMPKRGILRDNLYCRAKRHWQLLATVWVVNCNGPASILDRCRGPRI
jgi:hypothetical protein